MKGKFKVVSIIVAFTLSMLLAACGGNTEKANDSANNTDSKDNDGIELGQKDLTVPYVAWARELPVSYLYAAVLEDVGYNVELKQVEAGPMWSSVADGSADFFTGASLPVIHSEYEKKYGKDVVKVKMNDEQTINALSVPSYMEDVNSIEDLQNNKELGDSVDWKITGIDPGAGLMSNTEIAMDEYNLKDDWVLSSSSESAMLAELKTKYDKKEPIVVTLWTPHWAFGVWDLKMLDDPEGVYGDGDQIYTVARKGFEKDAPAAYKILEQYTEDPDLIAEELMAPIFNEDQDPEEVVRQFMDNHPDLIAEWTEGVK